MMNNNQTASLVFTIGHSTRNPDEFIQILQTHEIGLLADVRTVPRSRHNPQFNRDTLPEALSGAGIDYEHFPRLGGLRRSTLKDSPNKGWRNSSFRNYADYMLTAEFDAGLAELIELVSRRRIAIMCAEALPWRCHRSLIADALLVRGFRVAHIMGASDVREHSLTPWAEVDGLIVTYPATPGSEDRKEAEAPDM